MTPENKAKMLEQFRAFADRINERYDEVYDKLERGDYIGAQTDLANLTTSHAKTSLSLRNKLVRDGFIGEDS